jgi:phosphate uptake regulator
MPEVLKPRRKPLKVYPEPEAMLEELVRALERIADGVANISETLDAVVTMTKDRELAIRTVNE